MDDCNLELLSISLGSLSPVFHQDTLEYASSLGSQVQSVDLTLRTRDAGASCSISGEGVDGKSITLTEGVTSLITVEVVADDGSTKKAYLLRLKRLSTSDASLSSLSAAGGFPLEPDFSPDTSEYECHVPSSCHQLELSAAAPDPKTVISLGGVPLSPAPLHLGITAVQVVSTAPDGSHKKTYTISVHRQELPVILSTQAVLLAPLSRCSFCLSMVHKPHKTVSAGAAFLFFAECIKLLTRTNKENPVDGTPLTGDWLSHCPDIETELSRTKVGPIPPLADPVPLSQLANSWQGKRAGQKPDQTEVCKSCSKKVPIQDLGTHETHLCSSKFPPQKLEHKVEVAIWQKQLCSFLTDTDTAEFISEAKQQEQLYLQSLPSVYNDSFKYPAGTSPLGTLQLAASQYASAIKKGPKNWEAHMGLGRVMEERFYAGDVFGLKMEKTAKSDEDEEDEGAGAVKEAVESGKQDEFEALCRQKGVGPDAPLALQLKAVEQEYQALKEAGQQSEAEYVQSLYAWRSKQSHGAGGSKAGFSEEGSLGRARLKYTDAVSLAPGEHGPRFRLGRLLLDLGDAGSAIPHLQTALSIKPLHSETRLSLGIAWLRAGPLDLKKEASRLIIEGITQVLLADAEHKCSSPRPSPLEPPSLHCDVFPCWHTSTTLIRSCMDLSAYLSASPVAGGPTADTCLLWGAYLASRAMQRLLSHKETYTSMMWLVIETHSILLTSLVNTSAPREAVFQRCQQLTGLLGVCGLEASSSLADVKLKTSQQAAVLRPCSAQVLGLLGDAQLAKSDSEPSRQQALLAQAELSFRAALDCIGKPLDAKEPPPSLEKQDWWEQRKREAEATKQAAQAKPAQAGKTTAGQAKPAAGRGQAPAAGRGQAPATGKPAGAAGASRAGPKAPATKAPIKPAATNKPAAAPTKGGAANKQQQAVSKPTSKNVATLGQLKSGESTGAQAKGAPASSAPAQSSDTDKEGVNKAEVNIPTPTISSLVNSKTYHPFLGLARVLSRQNNPNTLQEAKGLYSQAIDICPGLHDAYIELADLLIENSPLEAVDVYLKYPFPDTPTFDDAYLYGEIVRILLKEGQYDDVRLVPNMVHLGKIMGISMLEKYVKILEDKFKTKALMQVYAGVHEKEVDDPGLVQFFRFKCWI